MHSPKALPPPPSTRAAFRIAVICALPEERDTVEHLMSRFYDEEGKDYGMVPGDTNHYTCGELGGKPVVLVAPAQMGIVTTRKLATEMRMSFPNIKWALIVGIIGGAPFKHTKEDQESEPHKEWPESGIQLGDVVISTQVLSDFGTQLENRRKRKTAVEETLSRAPDEVTNFLNTLKTGESRKFGVILAATQEDYVAITKREKYKRPEQTTDRVYPSDHRHKHHGPVTCICRDCMGSQDNVCSDAVTASCEKLGCVPVRTNIERPARIHFGRVYSGNSVLKSARERDILVEEDQCIGFEMEGAGAWEIFGTIVVKGIVDYADSHKSKAWRLYPAAKAALCARALIKEIQLPDAQLQHDTSGQ
jgi:nucleoside phosphorylase